MLCFLVVWVLCLSTPSLGSLQSSLSPLICLSTLSLSSAQSSFSPFSLLGSFFSSGPVPSRQRQRPPPQRQRPRPRPQPGPRIILRPNLVVGPSIKTPNFSASQPVPLRIKLEEIPTSRPTKSSRPPPSKSSRGGTDITPTTSLLTISTLPEIKATTKVFSNLTRPPEVTNHPESVETTEQPTEQPITVTIKNEIITSVKNQAEDRITHPSKPTRQTYLNDQNYEALVSGPNVDTAFSVSIEDLNRDNYYDDLLAPKPLNTYYKPQIFHYNQDPFILEDTLHQSISENHIEEDINSDNLQDLKFQIFPRGNVGSHRNQPIIISQIPVKSLQTSSKLIKNPMPPSPQNSFSTLPTRPTSPIFSLPISQHSHAVLSKQKEKSVNSKPHQSSVSPFTDAPTFIPFIFDTTINPVLETTVKSLKKEDIIVSKKIKRQPIFEVLPTPQQQQQFDFPRITEKSGRKVEYKISDYTANTIQDTFSGARERQSNRSINLAKLADNKSINLAKSVDNKINNPAQLVDNQSSIPSQLVDNQSNNPAKLVDNQSNSLAKLVDNRSNNPAKLVDNRSNNPPQLVDNQSNNPAKLVDNRSNNLAKLVDNRRSNLAQLVDCGAGSDVGFCAMSASYPKSTVRDLIKNCHHIIKAFIAVVPEDLSELGDNSPVSGPDGQNKTNHQDNSKPWSWKAYSYKKRQICDSELYFIKPGFARDTRGGWQLIIQTEDVQQRVAIDMCHSPGSPCPGVADCGTKSTCVQRYNYQLLLAMEIPEQQDTPSCPEIRAFKFPTSCICHVETYHNPNKKREHNVFFNKLTK